MQLQTGPDHHPIYDELCHVIYRCKEKAEKEGAQLASIIGVHKTTIWRWEQKLIRKKPQIEPVVRLLQYDSGIKTIDSLLRHYSGLTSTVDYLQQKYSLITKKNDSVQGFEQENLDKILDSFVSYLAIKLCSSSDRGETLEKLIEPLTHAQYEEFKTTLNGVSKETALKSLRPLVVEHLDNLVKAGHLVLNKYGHYETPSDFVQWPFELSKKFLPKMFMFVDPENWENTDYFTRGQSLSASEEDIYKATRILFKGYKDAVEILANSKGEHKVQLMAMFESLDTFSPPSSPIVPEPPQLSKADHNGENKGEVQ